MDEVLLARKRTALDHYREDMDDPAKELPEDEYEPILEGHQNHYNTVEAVRDRLEDEDLPYDEVEIPDDPDEAVEGYDMVVSVGGDGTVLDTSHYINGETPLLPVRSDPGSHGALCQYGADEIDAAFDVALEDPEIEEWTRAELEYGGKTAYALNEVFIADRHSMEVARYTVSDGEREEEHMNSGLVVTSGAGSTGWYNNIPGSDGAFPVDADELRYIEREPIRDEDQELNSGVLEPGEELEIRSTMNVDGIISLDGDREDLLFEFPRGATATVRPADSPLRVVSGD